MVVYGECVLDELSCAGPTKVCEFDGGDFHAPAFRTYELTPEQFGMARDRVEFRSLLADLLLHKDNT